MTIGERGGAKRVPLRLSEEPHEAGAARTVPVAR